MQFSLSQVSNLGAMNKLVKLQPAQKSLLAKNGFVCAPTTGKQLFHILEHNDYNNAPGFDSTLRKAVAAAEKSHRGDAVKRASGLRKE